jgi:drug/metabolite transporter (DMT)-like permease
MVIEASRSKEPVYALIFTIFSPVLLSTGGIGVRLLHEGPWTILFWRSVFMTVTLLAWIFITQREQFSRIIINTLKRGIWVSIFFALSFSFYVFSITNTTVADSLLIQGTAPIFIILFGWIILREPVRKISIAALFGILAGISAIIIPSIRQYGLSGNLFGIGMALAFASGTIAIRKRRSVNLLPSVALAAVFTIIFSAPFVENFSLSLKSFAILMYLGVIQLGMAFILFTSWSGKLPTSQTGLIVILEAILGPLWVWLFLGEAPQLFTFVGGGIIISTLIVHTMLYYRKMNT